MTQSALIFCTPASLSQEVAALPLLDRLVIACHRAGCDSIHLVARAAPAYLPRSAAWNASVSWSPTVPDDFQGPVMVIEASWLLMASDVESCMASGGRLTTPEGVPIPAGVVDARRLTQFQAGGGEPPWEDLLAQLTPVQTGDVACRVSNTHDAQLAARRLWRSITSSSDGLVDRWFNRPLGRALLSKALIHSPLTPNQISVISILIGLSGAWHLAGGQRDEAIRGALLFQISAVVDCVDGDVARMLYKESKLGKWLDIIGDQVVHAGIFVGIAVGLLRAGAPGPIAGLGIAAVLGALLSFLVVLRGMLSPHLRGSNPLQRFADAATSRDFSVLVLLLAVAGRLDWFLWLAAMGSQVFWITTLALQSRVAQPREMA